MEQLAGGPEASPLVDGHCVNSSDENVAFAWHVDNHAEQTKGGEYIEHSLVCLCSEGESSVMFAGAGEVAYPGVGGCVKFPAWVIHRTGNVAPTGKSMWKLARFGKKATAGAGAQERDAAVAAAGAAAAGAQDVVEVAAAVAAVVGLTSLRTSLRAMTEGAVSAGAAASEAGVQGRAAVAQGRAAIGDTAAAAIAQRAAADAATAVVVGRPIGRPTAMAAPPRVAGGEASAQERDAEEPDALGPTDDPVARGRTIQAMLDAPENRERMRLREVEREKAVHGNRDLLVRLGLEQRLVPPPSAKARGKRPASRPAPAPTRGLRKEIRQKAVSTGTRAEGRESNEQSSEESSESSERSSEECSPSEPSSDDERRRGGSSSKVARVALTGSRGGRRRAARRSRCSRRLFGCQARRSALPQWPTLPSRTLRCSPRSSVTARRAMRGWSS